MLCFSSISCVNRVIQGSNHTISGQTLLFCFVETAKCFGESQIAEIVGCELSLDGRKVNTFWLVEEQTPLNARVQEHAVQIGMSLRYTERVRLIYSSDLGEKKQAYLVTKLGILSSSVMSKGTALALSLPCL